MEREEGYYWVRMYDEPKLWHISYYDARLSRWVFMGDHPYWRDEDFVEIGLRVIHPEDDAKTIFERLTEKQVMDVISCSQPGDPPETMVRPDDRAQRVWLVGYDSRQLIGIIRVLRQLRPDLGIADAKAITDAVRRGTKCIVVEYATCDAVFEAGRAGEALASVGAEVYIQPIDCEV